jgi:hypothetical protein
METPASARKPWHGGCAEIACLDKALNAGVDPKGGSMRAVNIGASLSEAHYRTSAILWWAYLDGNNLTRDLEGQESLMARIAICMLSVTKDEAKELGAFVMVFRGS